MEHTTTTTQATVKEYRQEVVQTSDSKNARPPMRNAYIAPRNEVERTIVSIVEQVLGIHPVGVNDNFVELGGDSLAAVTVVDQINSRLCCKLRAIDFYDRSTAREAALSVEMSREEGILETLGSEQEQSRKSERRELYRSLRRQIASKPVMGN